MRVCAPADPLCIYLGAVTVAFHEHRRSPWRFRSRSFRYVRAHGGAADTKFFIFLSFLARNFWRQNSKVAADADADEDDDLKEKKEKENGEGTQRGGREGERGEGDGEAGEGKQRQRPAQSR